MMAFSINNIVLISACNVLMTEEKLFTLTNAGQARNCSLTAVISQPNLHLVQFEIGKPQTNIGIISPVSKKEINNYYYLCQAYLQ